MATITEWYTGFLCSCRGPYVSGKEPATLSVVYFSTLPSRNLSLYLLQSRRPSTACELSFTNNQLLAQEIGFSTPNSSTLPWLVQRATELCISKNECNKLDITRLSISNWSIIMVGPGGLLLAVPMYMQFQFQFY